MSHKKYKEKAHPVSIEDITVVVVVAVVQLLSRIWLFATPWNCSMPGFPGLHTLLEFAQIHVHWVGDAIQLSHPVMPFSSCPLSFSASESFPVSQLFTSGGQSIGASASAFQWILRVDLFYNWLVWSPCSPRDTQESSPAPQFVSISSLALRLYGPPLTSVHDYWENHSFNYTDLVSKVMSLLFNMLSTSVIAFLPRGKLLLFVVALTICSDFGDQENKVCHCFYLLSPICLPWSDGTRFHDLSFFECCLLSQLFHSPLLPSSGGSLVLLCFLL